MTEAEWLACDDPSALLECMAGSVPARKVRLALCAYLRTSEIWPLLTAPASRRAVEIGEAFAEGNANLQALGQARKNANAVAGRGYRGTRFIRPAAYLANYVCLQDRNLLTFLHLPSGCLKQLRPPATLLRDVIGNPFRKPTRTSSWLVPAVVAIVQTNYAERSLPSGELDPAHLAVLADALEESGCAEADILSHLRSPGPHVRGCWALDLVQGKE